MVVRRLSVLLALLALALVAVPVSGAGQSNAQRLAAVESQIVREINRVTGRRRAAPAQGVSGSAQRGVRAQPRDARGTASSTTPRPTGRRPPTASAAATRCARTGPGPSVRRSSPRSGALTAREAVARWLASPGHRGILLSTQWREVGIGVARSPLAGGAFDNLPTTVATADFGAR